MIGATLSLHELGALVVRSSEIESWIANQLASVANKPDDDILGAIAQGVDDKVLTVHAGCVICTPCSALEASPPRPARQQRAAPGREP